LRTENKNNNLNLYSLKINSEFYLTNLIAKKLKFVDLNNLYFYLLSFSQNSIKQNKLKKHLYDILKSIFLTINIDSIYCIKIIENLNIFCEVIVVKNITSNDLKIENNVNENIIKKIKLNFESLVLINNEDFFLINKNIMNTKSYNLFKNCFNLLSGLSSYENNNNLDNKNNNSNNNNNNNSVNNNINNNNNNNNNKNSCEEKNINIIQRNKQKLNNNTILTENNNNNNNNNNNKLNFQLLDKLTISIENCLISAFFSFLLEENYTKNLK
jgi:hypothetical protein